jgi:CRISPR/Cas system-associated protein endoribonuclease Cas2
MPDLLHHFSRWWKPILGFTLFCSLIALIACLLTQKKYLSTATALPTNSALSDRARIFNPNIEALYSEFGSPDDLDRIEGTAMLDTLYIAAVEANRLIVHYEIENKTDAVYRAARQLKKSSSISRSGYGELKINVWDKDRTMAAQLANDLLQRIQQLHQQLRNQGNARALNQIKEEYTRTEQQFRVIADSLQRSGGPSAEIIGAKKAALLEQLQENQKLIAQYSLSLNTNPPVLVTVERARPALKADKPDTAKTVALTAFASFVLVFLLSFLPGGKRVSA